MSPQKWTSVFALVGVIAACANDSTPQDDGGSGGACVPGASVMCWCDGVTPGVQVCQDDMVFASCVCDNAGSGSTTSGEVSTTDGDISGSTEGAGSTEATTTQGASTSGGASMGSTGTTGSTGDTTGGTEGTGDLPPTGCTDELFSLWHACVSLASWNNPNPCDPCKEDTVCENALCMLSCKEQGNPGQEAALEECENKYPQCEELYESQQTDSQKCLSACSEGYNQCLADAAPQCEQVDSLACATEYGECNSIC